ncbi:calcium:proton antiporter [Paracoccus alkanivorans]|uniref:Calcium:proton antiporter n=1 Tax=Paracoccus alkanivorans TaxID=2116655 RepID=A0A3M0MIV1_9RHOB|nr:calcium:proton antiporter [Paracoccus alkanivorans]RMC36164.1 calcium:proton antiporter [Paracoccus alkanivorans]
MKRILYNLIHERPILAVIATLAIFNTAPGAFLHPATAVWALLPFIWLFAVMIWGASAVVHHAEALADRLGEPYGTLILTLSVVVIEVALIGSVMLSGDGGPTLARDTMFAVLMIVLNGLVGLALLLGALRHGEQSYNFAGASAFLTVLVPLAVFGLTLPAYTISSPDDSFSTGQALFFSVVTLALYGVFLSIQTVRHRGFFTEAEEPPLPSPASHAHYATWAHAFLLLATLLPIVLLSKKLAGFVDHGINAMNLPGALGGVVIATIVLASEGMSAVRAALANRLQRAVNLCLGAALSTIGLTVPAVLVIALTTGQEVVLGLGPQMQVMLALTLIVCVQTFGTRRTNVLHGAVHLVLFLAYLMLVLEP